MPYRILLSCFTIFSMLALHAQEKWNLEQCINYALENNITIKQSEIQGEILSNNLQQSKFSRLPNLNASGSHNYNIGRTIDPFTNTFENQSIQSNVFSLNSGVVLYGGNQVNNQIKQSKLALAANNQGIEVAQNQISLLVAQAFLQIVQAEENLKTAEAQLELTKEQLNQAEKRVNSGASDRSIVFNLNAQKANDRVQVINAQNSIQLAYNQMLNLLQIDNETPFEIERVKITSVPNMPSESVADIYRIALASLPEIKQAELTIQQNEMGEKLASASLLPRLTAFGNINTVFSESGRSVDITGYTPVLVGVTENSQEQVFGLQPQFDYQTIPFGTQLSDNLGQSFGLSLNIPIFNGMRNSVSVKNAELNTQISELNLLNTKNQLRSDVTTAYTNLKTAKTSYDAALESGEAQRLNYEFASKRFESGMMNSVDLLNAKNQWFASQINTINAKYEYVFRNLIIEFYKGNELKL
jgi:outer membrane protein